ncbi:MAG: hypothetical protein MHMPM18_004055 [Marteilia pararefringens]
MIFLSIPNYIRRMNQETQLSFTQSDISPALEIISYICLGTNIALLVMFCNYDCCLRTCSRKSCKSISES